MQMRRTTSDEARDVLNESLNRILSISLVHETLSHHDEENIDISDVAQKLLGLLAHSLVSKDCHVETKFSGDTLPTPSDAATSLALVLNELITNAIIHGFEGRREGLLAVTIRRDGPDGVIIVCDDGVGMSHAPVDRGANIWAWPSCARSLKKICRGRLISMTACLKGPSSPSVFRYQRGENNQWDIAL